MRLGGRFEHGPQVQRVVDVPMVVVQLHLAGEFRPGQLLQKCGVPRVAGAVDKLEILDPRGIEMPHHRQDRRDADTPGDKHEAACAWVQLEVIARRADRQHASLVHLVSHGD